MTATCQHCIGYAAGRCHFNRIDGVRVLVNKLDRCKRFLHRQDVPPGKLLHDVMGIRDCRQITTVFEKRRG